MPGAESQRGPGGVRAAALARGAAAPDPRGGGRVPGPRRPGERGARGGDGAARPGARRHARAAQWPLRARPGGARRARGVVQATAESEHVRGLVTRRAAAGAGAAARRGRGGLLPADQLGRPRTGGEVSARADRPRRCPRARTRWRPGSTPGGGDVGRRRRCRRWSWLPWRTPRSRRRARSCGATESSARAVERALVQATGLDPTGVVVTEAGHAAQGGPAYLGALAAYATGTPEGVGLWLGHCADAVVAGAAHGRADLRRGARGPADLAPPGRAGPRRRRDPPAGPKVKGFLWRRGGGTHGGKSTDEKSDDHRDPIGHPRAGSPLVDRS